MELVNPRGTDRIGICPECRKVFRIFPQDWIPNEEDEKKRPMVKCLTVGCVGIIDQRDNSRVEGT